MWMKNKCIFLSGKMYSGCIHFFKLYWKNLPQPFHILYRSHIFLKKKTETIVTLHQFTTSIFCQVNQNFCMAELTKI